MFTCVSFFNETKKYKIINTKSQHTINRFNIPFIDNDTVATNNIINTTNVFIQFNDDDEKDALMMRCIIISFVYFCYKACSVIMNYSVSY